MTAPQSYSAPLTNSQRLSILQQISSYSGQTLAAVASSINDQAGTYGFAFNGQTGALNKMTGAIPGTAAQFDDLLIADYQNVLTHPAGQAGFGGSPSATDTQYSGPNPIASVESFLTQLSNPNLWVRVAEFGIGGLMLAIGLFGIIKGATGASPTKVLRKANPVSLAKSGASVL